MLKLTIIKYASMNDLAIQGESKGYLVGVKPLNNRESRAAQQHAMSTFETVSNYMYTVGLENAVLPMPLRKIEIPTTFAKATNSEYSKEWLNLRWKYCTSSCL